MPAASRKPKPGRVRKNIELDQKKLDELKKYFGVKTETEALDRAMSEILFEHRIFQGLERLERHGGLEEVFPDGALERMRATRDRRERAQARRAARKSARA
jgi:Xaa-Pro aminopeptidase